MFFVSSQREHRSTDCRAIRRDRGGGDTRLLDPAPGAGRPRNKTSSSVSMLIPTHVVHRFRGMPSTGSDAFRPPWCALGGARRRHQRAGVERPGGVLDDLM